MRYLTEIRDKDGRLPLSLLDKIEDIGKCSFSAYDEDVQKTVDVDIRSNCLGITTFKDNEIEYVAAAVHNENTAKLYRFIEFIGTQPISTSDYVPDDDSDICFEVQCDRNRVLNAPTLTVKLANSTMVLGEWCSVVIRGASSWSYCGVYTIYDFLLELCRAHMLNFMHYETIRLVDTTAMMTIKLVHSSEADSFFTEMYELSTGSGIKRYVSKIQVDGECIPYAIWSRVSNTVVTTTNMDTGVTEEVSDFPIDDCYGFSPRRNNGTCVIVCHTPPAVQLYKYIELAKTRRKGITVPPGFWVEYADFKLQQDDETKTLKIIVKGTAIKLYEPCSSVVYVKNFRSSSYKFISLYDFLISLCKLTDLNVMLYDTVKITSDCWVGETEIRFRHEREADRFFLKMYMLKALE